MSTQDMDVQEFISLSVTRQLAVKLGEDDPALGEPWSASIGGNRQRKAHCPADF